MLHKSSKFVGCLYSHVVVVFSSSSINLTVCMSRSLYLSTLDSVSLDLLTLYDDTDDIMTSCYI